MAAASASRREFGVGLRADEAQLHLRRFGNLGRRDPGARGPAPAASSPPRSGLAGGRRRPLPAATGPTAVPKLSEPGPNGRRTASHGACANLPGTSTRVEDESQLRSAVLMDGNSDDCRAVLPARCGAGVPNVDSDPIKWRRIRPAGRGTPLALREASGAKAHDPHRGSAGSHSRIVRFAHPTSRLRELRLPGPCLTLLPTTLSWLTAPALR